MLKPFLAQAAHQGTKTMTRRTKGLEFFNKKPQMYRYDGLSAESQLHYLEEITADGEPREYYLPVECPFGQVGDLIWIKETYYNIKGEYAYLGSMVTDKFEYSVPSFLEKKAKSSMLMPKVAARTWGVITSIKVERLQDITEEDAKAEGVEIVMGCTKFLKRYGFRNYLQANECLATIVLSFKSLWESINGEGSWDANPWVWVIEWEKCDAPQLEGGVK